MPRPCAAITSRRAVAGVATGSSAMLSTPGRSLFVRLAGPDNGKGAAGKWTDAATGQHGDLLDLLALNRGLERLHDVLDEARSFLSLPRSEPPSDRCGRQLPAVMGSSESARRLFAMSRPISRPHRLILAAALRLYGQPSHADRRND
jgi:hypothetical protein